MSAQEEQAKQEREVEAQGEHESEVKAHERHEGEVKAQGEQEEDANSLPEECHVSNRHMTCWHNAWWIRVDNGPHMRSARGRRRTWRAARQAAEQVRNGSWAGETREGAEEAERQKGEKGGKSHRQRDRQDRAVRTLCTSSFTCQKWQLQQTPVTTAAAIAARTLQ